MNLRRCAGLLLLAGLPASGVTAPTWAQDNACLRIDEAIGGVIARSNLTRAAEQDVLAAKADERATATRWRPQISAFARSAGGDTGLSTVQLDNQVGLKATQRLYDFGRSRLEREQAKAGTQLSKAQLRLTEAELAFETGSLYLDMLEATEQIRLLTGRITYLEMKRNALETMLERQAATQTELSEARGDLARARAESAATAQRLQQARTALTTRLGGTPDPCNNGFTEVWLRALNVQQGQRESLINDAIEADPAVAVDRARVASLRLKAELAGKSRLPVIELAGTTAYAYDQREDVWGQRNQIGLEFSVPLVTGGRLSARQSASNAEAAAARYREQETIRELRQAILVSATRIKSLEAEAEQRTQVVLAMQQQFEGVETEYRLQAATSTRLAESRALLDDALIAGSHTRFTLLRERLRLAGLLGRLRSGADANPP